MATTAKILYGTSAAITLTLASLATSTAAAGVGRESAAVDNTADLADDAIVGGKIKTGTTTANTQIEIWVAGSYDGTSYTGGATGADAGLTLIPAVRILLKPLLTIPIPDTTARTYTWAASIAQAFGGVMPKKWSIFVLNSSGANLDATAGNHELKYTPVQYQSV
jgi:hypothetical protein